MANASFSSSVKDTLRRVIPNSLLKTWSSWVWGKRRQRFGGMPIADAFSRVYRDGMWGAGSGPGSDDSFRDPYVAFVRSFVHDHNIQSVVDIGCGDFRIGGRLAEVGLNYTGIDIVPDLIQSHKKGFERDGVRFICLDATTSVPPQGDLCLIRQVLQHLSNDEVMRILNHCRHFPFVLITEHLPIGEDVEPNMDKPHGPDTRIRNRPRSGIFLDQPPFSRTAETVLECPYRQDEVLRTVLLRNPS